MSPVSEWQASTSGQSFTERAKVSVGKRSVAYAFFRGPARWLWTKLWPLLP